MAIDCNVANLKAAATCFMPKCMGDLEREAIDMYILMADLAALGGTDYLNNLSALEVDGKDWERLAQGERRAIITYINLQNAIANGADFGGDTSANNLKALSKCLQCFGPESRKGLMTLLKCQLSNVTQPISEIVVIGGEETGVIIGGEGGGMIGVEGA